MDKNRRKLDWIVGLVVAGAGITGVVGLWAAFSALYWGKRADAGICLIAAALAFGLLANAVLRE
jgi:hypothetical protein